MKVAIADPTEYDSLQQRQQIWNDARRKPMVRRITPPPNRPCVALCQSTAKPSSTSIFTAAINQCDFSCEIFLSFSFRFS